MRWNRHHAEQRDVHEPARDLLDRLPAILLTSAAVIYALTYLVP